MIGGDLCVEGCAIFGSMKEGVNDGCLASVTELLNQVPPLYTIKVSEVTQSMPICAIATLDSSVCPFLFL